MTTLTVPDIPLEATAPAQRLRRHAAAVRVSMHWWGVHRSLTNRQKEEVSAAYAADARFVTAGKKLVDTRHDAFRKLTAVRTRIVSYWRGLTLPYTEPGVRLIRQCDVEAFAHTMEGFRDELTQAESDLNGVYHQIKEDALRRLGRLFDPADYPEEVRGLFAVEWDFPSVEPPSYLMRISPELYQQEQERVARRLEEGGQRRIFRDSAVTNLLEFFERFRRLNVRSSQDLDRLVEQAQGLVRGVTPQALRDSDELRGRIAAQMGPVQTQLDALVVERPRRQLVRPGPGHNGEPHAAGG